MTENDSSTRPRLIIQRMAERRKTTYLKGPPFINQEGLILVDRRTQGERRRGARKSAEICALLRHRPN